MKQKIEYTATSYFLFRAPILNIITLSLVTRVKQDIWISVLLGILVGIFPILLYKRFATNCKTNIILEGSKLFPKCKFVINIILGGIAFLYSLIILLNISLFIKNQYLINTPSYIIIIFILLPVTYLLNQKEKIIPRVSFILFILSIIFIITSIIGLTQKINLGNIFPILEYNPIKGIIPYISFSIIPGYLLLIFPNKKIKDSIFPGYILASITMFLSVFYLISVLGINLVQLFQYPEVHTLKESFSNNISIRLANFLSLQWILDSFIFITISTKYCNKSFKIKNNYVIPLILFILTIYLFPKQFLFNLITNYLFSYLILLTLIIFIIFLYKQKKNN